MMGNETVQVFEEAARLQRAGQPCVLATVIASRGSSPRKSGARMVVRADGSITGTIGGGAVEQEVISSSLRALADGSGPATATFTLDETFGHACGGELTVLIEPLGGMPRLVVCGAGHVGKALTQLATFAGFRVCVIDDRPGFANLESLPDAAELHSGDYAAEIEKVKVIATDAVVIATPCYASDMAAAWAALATPARFIGVIGSRRKRETMFRDLAAAGASQADIDRIVIPVGLDIGGCSPQEISVSIVAQLIKLRYHG
jgi:xanthine dehydrogenase accessory factor